MQNTRLITNATFELVSPKQIIVNNGKYTWLNDYQFKAFDVWKNDYISKELISEYNEESVNNKKIIDDLMKELLVNVVMYQLEKCYHIYRLDNRKIRVLFVNIFSKVKRVPKVKRITIPDILVPDLGTTRIMSLKEKIKNRKTLSYSDWINFKSYFVYNQNLSDKNA